MAPVEHQSMQMLLAGDQPALKILRLQFDQSSVVERDFTGLGFFTSFRVTERAPPLDPRTRIVIADVCSDVVGLEHGCGFVLFVEDGVIDTLECHLWGDNAYPDNANHTRLYYTHQPKPPNVAETALRDMDAVLSKFT